MTPCPYCGTPMSNPQRVQCGAPGCKRAHKAVYMRRWHREHKERTGSWWNSGVRRTSYPCTCIHCGTEWDAYSKTARFCSFTCQNAHQYGEGRTRKKSQGEKRRAAAVRRLARAARGSRGRTAWVSGRCSECGGGFAAQQPDARTCSPGCREARRRRRSVRGFISPEGRLAIYERDAWTCQLCFGPVDPAVHYLDDWAPTLDHIVCRSWSEVPDHSAGNLRLAHRWCNSVRGDERTWSAGVLEGVP